MEFLGYIALIFMGITLGLIGAGGSILTIPIMIYLFDIPIMLATSYSLIVVGLTALMASIGYRNHILFKKSMLFLIPSVLGVFVMRYFMMPNLPHSIGSLPIDKALLVLLLLFIGFAGYFMSKNSLSYPENISKKNHHTKVIAISLILGIIMGLIGAGGGFLIIPTLVLFMGFKIKEAVATSLFIITINSFIGFAADKHHLLFWMNLIKYLPCALLGMIIGLYIAKFMRGEVLKKSFGYFIWMIGAAIITKEFIL
jgi:uncharacterized membrane protein YfcA